MSAYDDLTIDQIRQKIRAFKNDEDVIKLANYYHSKSMPEILGVSRKEIPHSNFLAWYLNPEENISLGRFPIEKFLELIVAKSDRYNFANFSEFVDAIIISDFDINIHKVETEIPIKGGRIDLLIKGKIQFGKRIRNLTVVLENKVESKEQEDQTLKYYEHFEKNKKDDDIILYIYLSAISSLALEEMTEPVCSCKEFIHINYQSIVDFIIDPSLKRNISERTKSLINEYLLCLSHPSINKEDKKYNQGLIMALGKDERKLLTKFWEKHDNLIMATLYAISSDPEQEEETRENVTGLIDSLSTRDNSQYQFKGKIYKKSPLVHAVVKDYVAQNPDITYAQLEQIFPKNLQGSTGVFATLQSAVNIIESTERKYKRHYIKIHEQLKLADSIVVTTNQWGAGKNGNIDGFVNYVNSNDIFKDKITKV